MIKCALTYSWLFWLFSCFCFTSGGWPCDFPPKYPQVAFGLPYLLIELCYIGMHVVLTDGRLLGRAVYVHVITKFSRMDLRFKNISKLRKKYSNHFIEFKVRLTCTVFNAICNVMYLSTPVDCTWQWPKSTALATLVTGHIILFSTSVIYSN